MADRNPPLLRPIPRRPFDMSLKSPTPPSDDSTSPSPHPESDASRLLSPKHNGYSAATPSETGSISRTQSLMNLTASTLFGIYSPSSSRRDRFDREELDTPWGTGSQTPVKRRSVDEPTFELMKDRSSLLRRRSSRAAPPSTSVTGSIFVSVSRAVLLFFLGVGYGALVTKTQNGRRLTALSVEAAHSSGYDWQTLVLWGVLGVVLGMLLPWFDGVWAKQFGAEVDIVSGEEEAEGENRAGTDWAVVVRSIGAFVGIVFAIRRLPWASTLQVSLTLALVNPFLWYLIDRSKPGFLLSAAVGLMGSAVILGVNPDSMPTPATFASSASTPVGAVPGVPAIFGELASQETLETGIWMLSVLFCSSVCFGNIGRRLAPNTPSVARGRWAGVK